MFQSLNTQHHIFLRLFLFPHQDLLTFCRTFCVSNDNLVHHFQYFNMCSIFQKSMIVAEISNYDMILNKLRQFNNELSVCYKYIYHVFCREPVIGMIFTFSFSKTQEVRLTDTQIDSIVKLVEILKNPSTYQISQVTDSMIDSLEFALVNWPLTKIFPGIMK
jgi:hypothetical protein